MIWILTALLMVPLFGALLAADEAASPMPRPSDPPRVFLALPLGVTTGSPQRFSLRGQFLTNAVSVRLIGVDPASSVRLLSAGDAAGIEGYDTNRVGSERLDLELTLPLDTPSGTNVSLVVVTPTGESVPFPLFVTPPDQIISEAEPNNGFQSAPIYPEGRIVRGSLDEVSDVDVFRFDLRAGQSFRAEVWAARLGATLDGSLSLHDRHGATLMMNDDGDGTGRDPLLEFQAASDGTVLLAVSGVTEKAGAASVYLLEVQVSP